MSEPPWPPGSYAEAHAEERAKIEAEHAEKRAKFEAEYAEGRAKFEAERKATENEPAAAMLDITDLDDEDLACAGLRRAFEDDFFSDLKKQAQEEYFANLPKPPKPRKPSKSRKPSIAAQIKQAEKAGKQVTSITTADGTTLTFTDAEHSGAIKEWDDAIPRRARHQ